MITPDGWLDWAIRYPGPDAKSGYWPNINESNAEGVDFHSAEGSASSLLSLVNNLQRQASWTASNMKDGKFYQHYSVRRIVWTNGSMLANVKFRGVESEGVAGEPLTAPQTANLIRCGADMRDFFGWPGFVRRQQAWEHNEMTAYGAAPTACPSGRIPWQAIIAGITQSEEDDMAGTEELLTKIELHLKNISVKADSLGNLDREMDVLLLETQRIKALIEAHAGSLPHTHQ